MSYTLYINDQLDSFDMESALPKLSPQRLEQANRFRNESSKRACVVAYLLLAEGLQKQYGITEPPFFVYGEHGKPSLRDYPHIHFNISHCRQAVICVIGDSPVGCDVESISRYKESLVKYTMNEEEQNAIRNSESPEVEFTRLWTRKEAAVKLSGRGLQTDMKTILNGSMRFDTTICKEKGYVYSAISQEMTTFAAEQNK